MKKIVLMGALLTLGYAGFSQKYKVILKTDQGTIEAILYDKTPLHQKNFVKLAKKKFYNGLLFHRVIQEFMIQGGDPESRNAKPGAILGNGDTGEKIPAEFRYEYYHKRGALAAARDGNPEKASSGCQFYIVQGRKYTAEQLKKMEEQNEKSMAEAHKRVYETEGGTPFLDGQYTVFGEVTKGMEVVDKIAAVKKDRNDRPAEDQHIISVKVKKKFLGRFW
ncbi:MAG: peptidylprolyl isomerase [Sphingobacteriales bacterium]|nr:MAG: peptidylprolyl isomerase [Sphingobacteriales bacterium]